MLEVGVFEDDERIAAAGFDHNLLEVRAGLRCDRCSGALATSDGDAGDAVILYDATDLVDGREHVGVRADRCTGLLEETRESECALRHRLGVLGDDCVTRDELGRRDACELVVREVPRLNGQDGTDGRGLDERTRRLGQLDRGQELLSAIGVVVEDGG